MNEDYRMAESTQRWRGRRHPEPHPVRPQRTGATALSQRAPARTGQADAGSDAGLGAPASERSNMGLAPMQLGHLVLNVRDLDRAEHFYTRILGLTVTAKFDGNAVFMSANTDLSHELLLVSPEDYAPEPESQGPLVHAALADGVLRRPQGAAPASQGQRYPDRTHWRPWSVPRRVLLRPRRQRTRNVLRTSQVRMGEGRVPTFSTASSLTAWSKSKMYSTVGFEGFRNLVQGVG